MSDVSKTSRSFDRTGSLASTLCALHCAFCALLPAALPALGLGFLLGHTTEWAFTIFAITCALVVLFLGRARHRKRPLPALLLIAGLLGLGASRVIEMKGGHEDHEEHHGSQIHAGSEHPGTKPASTQHEHPSDHGQKGEKDGHHDQAHQADSHHDQAHHDGDHHGDHVFGGIIGIFAGLLLLAGHILNLRDASAASCCEE